MVRVKFRYLVCQILYPSPTPSSSSSNTSTSTKTTTTSPSTPLQIHAPTPDAFNAGVLIRYVRDAVADLYGDYGSGVVSSSLKAPYLSPSTSTFILRCPRDHYALVWAALTLTTTLPRVDAPVVIQVIRVSGTIRKAEEEVLRRARALVKRVREGEVRAGEESVLRGVGRAVERGRREGLEVQEEEDDDDD